jgi:hypothetical protein
MWCGVSRATGDTFDIVGEGDEKKLFQTHTGGWGLSLKNKESEDSV